MPRERPITFIRPGIPDFRHTILGAGDDPQRVRRKRPDAFDVPEIGTEAFLRCGVP